MTHVITLSRRVWSRYFFNDIYAVIIMHMSVGIHCSEINRLYIQLYVRKPLGKGEQEVSEKRTRMLIGARGSRRGRWKSDKNHLSSVRIPSILSNWLQSDGILRCIVLTQPQREIRDKVKHSCQTTAMYCLYSTILRCFRCRIYSPHATTSSSGR